MRGLELLREAVNGPEPEPDPVEQLEQIAKTFGGRTDVAKHQAADDRDTSSPVEQDAVANVHKVLDVLDLVISPLDRVLAVAKTGRQKEPPGLHHTSEKRNCADCQFWTIGKSVDVTATAIQGPAGGSIAGVCDRYNWPVDRDEVCRTWEQRDE
jgi:hypothetical protein